MQLEWSERYGRLTDEYHLPKGIAACQAYAERVGGDGMTQALQAVRQQTVDWQTRYNRRAGVKGTLSQEVNAFGFRRSHYMSLAKTHLQYILTSAAINVVRMVAWLQGQPHAKTRRSRFASLAPTNP